MIRKILIFGNSGSGKSTRAKELKDQFNINHLDLDTLVFEPNKVAIRRPQKLILKDILEFLSNNNKWVIEGCYGSLLGFVSDYCSEIHFLNPGTDICIAHNKARPWEPHKYESKEKQDEQLEMLLSWVKDYEIRNDEFSLKSHRDVFSSFSGTKKEYTKDNQIYEY
jgi:adenylate kinase family enzyme